MFLQNAVARVNGVPGLALACKFDPAAQVDQ